MRISDWSSDVCSSDLRAAGQRQTGLLGAGDDVERDAGGALHLVQELGAVAGAPAGFGGNRAGDGDAAAGHLLGADLQRIDGARYGRLRQPAGAAQALAEADDEIGRAACRERVGKYV